MSLYATSMARNGSLPKAHEWVRSSHSPTFKTNTNIMKHTDVKIWESVWIKMTKRIEGDGSSIFKTTDWTSYWLDSNDLLDALTEEDVNNVTAFSPEVGKEYEFSNDGVDWYQRELKFFQCANNGRGNEFTDYFKYIRPITEKTTIEIDKKHEMAVRQYISSLK